MKRHRTLHTATTLAAVMAHAMETFAESATPVASSVCIWPDVHGKECRCKVQHRLLDLSSIEIELFRSMCVDRFRSSQEFLRRANPEVSPAAFQLAKRDKEVAATLLGKLNKVTL